MTNTKTTKRALFASVLSLLLCISMLVGSTFAWFTDSASTGVGSIVAGTLDIDLVDGAGNSLEGKTIGFVNADENTKWEPGCRYTLETIKLVNKGNLNAKYKVVISATTGDVDLANVIDVYEGETNLGTLRDFLDMTDGIKEGVIAPGETLAFDTLTLVMQTTAGNEYQGKSITDISITVLATQATVEYDSKDNQYDANAQYPELPTDKWDGTTTAEPEVDTTLGENVYVIDSAAQFAGFAAAVNAGDNFAGKTVKLTKNINLANEKWTAIKDFAGTFDGQGHTISNLKDAALFAKISGDAVVKNLNLKGANRTASSYNGAGATFIGTVADNAVVDNCNVSDVTLTWANTVKDCGDGISGVFGAVNAGATVQNCEIKDVSITTYGKTKRAGGVFASISGTVKNCVFTDVNFSINEGTNEGYSSDYVGGLASAVTGNAVVEDCEINNMQVNVYEAYGHLGGIFGKAQVSGSAGAITLKDITVNGLTMNVGNAAEGMKCVAGFIAQPDSRSNDVRVAIDNCHINGLDMTLVSSKQSESAAAGFISGLCGGVDITNCSVSGKIDGSNTANNIGGFIGDAGWYGSIEQNFTNCVTNVDITVKNGIAGGFIAVDGTLSSGGVYGGTATLNFTNCEANGSVTVVDGGTGTAAEFCGKTIE